MENKQKRGSVWRLRNIALIIFAVALLAIILYAAEGPSKNTYNLGSGQFVLESSNPEISIPIFIENSLLVVTYPTNTLGSYPSYSHALSIDNYSNVIEYSFTATWNTNSTAPYEFDDMYTFLSTNIYTWNGEEIGITDEMRGGNGYGIIKAYVQPSNNTPEIKRTLFNNDRRSHNYRIVLENRTANFYADGSLIASIYGVQVLTNQTYNLVIGGNRWSDNFSSNGDTLYISNMTITVK